MYVMYTVHALNQEVSTESVYVLIAHLYDVLKLLSIVSIEEREK